MTFLQRASRQAGILSLLASVAFANSANRAADLITPDDLKAGVFFLASRDLLGRNAGSNEDHIAADYIAAEFMRLGLKPVGDDGTYFQNMEFKTGDVDMEHTTLSAEVNGIEHTYHRDQDFNWVRQSLRTVSAAGEVVFAGYGIDAPEYGYNDFAGIDLQGKVVLVLNREPQANDPQSKFAGTWDTYHAFNWQKLEEVRKRGAAVLLLVRDRVPRAVKVTQASSPRASGGPSFALAGQMWDIPTLSVSRDVADQLLAPGGKTCDQLQSTIDSTLEPASLEVRGSTVSMSKSVRDLQSRQGRNVVAMLDGSDPNLRSETLLITAHHDHMGEANGHIYNGADDNASGVVGLLEIAKAFVRGKVHPKRSVLFIAYDGEERIFLGSYYYAAHPIVPLKQTVAQLNLDMIGRNENDANWPVPADGNVNMVNVLGTRYNPGLRKAIDDENRHVGLKLDYKMDRVDPDSLWSRSDHFWFAALHIPQVEFQTGLHPDYHTDHDTWDRINYPKMTKIVRLVFLAADQVANSSERLVFVPAAPLGR